MVNALVTPGVAEDTVFLCLETEKHREAYTYCHIAQPSLIARHRRRVDMIHHKRRLERMVEVIKRLLSFAAGFDLRFVHALCTMRVDTAEADIHESGETQPAVELVGTLDTVLTDLLESIELISTLEMSKHVQSGGFA